MDYKCIVKNCTQSSGIPELFFSPQDDKLLKVWQKVIGTKEDNFLICDRHFSKRDMYFEKSLKEKAVPTLNLYKDAIKLEGNVCGMCLEDVVPDYEISKEYRDWFVEISGCEPLTDFMCRGCEEALTKYNIFKTKIYQKQDNIRTAANAQMAQIKKEPLDDDDDDCMIVEEHLEVPPVIKHKLINCFYCIKFQTTDEKFLLNHIKDRHSFQCDECYFFCGRLKELEAHILKTHKNLNLECGSCALKGFLSTSVLNLHLERIHHVKAFPCIYCETLFDSAMDLRTHVAHKHPYSNRKEFEKKKFASVVKPQSTPQDLLSNILKNKVKKVDQAKEIEDPLDYLNVEIKTEPEEPSEDKNADYNKANVVIKKEIEEIFADQMPELEELEEDLLVPMDEINEVVNSWQESVVSSTIPLNSSGLVKCLDCNKLMSVEELLVHRLAEHPSSDDEEKNPKVYARMPTPPLPPHPRIRKVKQDLLIACEFCFLEVFEKNLETHIENCHTDKPKKFLCHVCSLDFTFERALIYHLKKHNPDEFFLCDLCEYSNVRKCKIKHHIERNHLNIVNFVGQCKICEKKFTTRTKRSHMEKYHENGYDCGARVNNETNYYDCHQCGASYLDLYTYRRHDCEKGRFQLRCSDCQKPVKNVESLKIHQDNKCKVRCGPYLYSRN